MRYADAMYTTCLRLVRDRDDAKDIVQEAFMDMFLKIGSLNDEASFGAWFKRMVINKSLNFIKKSKACGSRF